MLRCFNYSIVFQEVPNEVSLAINISGCPNRCPDCHSKHLWEDVGEDMTTDFVESLVSKYEKDITCVCFMGGDNDQESVVNLAEDIKKRHGDLKIAWYSGKDGFPNLPMDSIDYMKVGGYRSDCGGLDKATTNQRMYKKCNEGHFVDITEMFRKQKVA